MRKFTVKELELINNYHNEPRKKMLSLIYTETTSQSDYDVKNNIITILENLRKELDDTNYNSDVIYQVGTEFELTAIRATCKKTGIIKAEEIEFLVGANETTLDSNYKFKENILPVSIDDYLDILLGLV